MIELGIEIDKIPHIYELCQLAVNRNPDTIKDFSISKQGLTFDQYLACFQLAIRKNGLVIQHLSKTFPINESYSLWLLAVENTPLAIQFLPSSNGFSSNGFSSVQLEKLYFQAVQKNGLALEFVPIKYYNSLLIWTAIQNNRHSFNFLDQSAIKLSELQQIYYYLLSKDGSFISKMKQTSELCFIAVSRDPLSLFACEKQTTELCQLAITGNIRAVKMIRNLTSELAQFAIKQDPQAIEFFPSFSQVSEDVLLQAIKTQSDVIQFIPITKQSYSICRKVIEQDSTLVKHITNLEFLLDHRELLTPVQRITLFLENSNRFQDLTNVDKCPICFEYTKLLVIHGKPEHNHAFCVSCLRHIKQQLSCPLCREKLNN